MSAAPFDQTATRVRAGQREQRGGGTVEDWSPDAVDETPVEHLSIQPNAQHEEHSDAGNPRTTGYRIISEPGTVPDIRATDRLRWRGQTYTVRGEVALWSSPVPGDDHVELVMVRHEGR